MSPIASSTTPDFIFIDDDDMVLKIQQLIFKKVMPDASIRTFNDAGEGIEYINTVYSTQAANTAVLFLDINMPGITGWEAIDALRTATPEVLQRLGIFMLSSSIDVLDMERAKAEPMVLDFISKPLTKAGLQTTLSQYYGIAGA